MSPKTPFTRYQIFVVALLAFLQFTVVLDFMILSPLGAMLLGELSITPAQFGRVVSAYALSAGASGLAAAGFADRFDRRRFLLVFYAGFVLGTFLCGIAPTYRLLLAARVVTGLFGGVIGSISFAIIADLFPLAMRGRVAGLVQASFAAAQVMGLPIGLFLANHWGWHAPFLMIVAVAIVAGVSIVVVLKPITAHLEGPNVSRKSPVEHLVKTATRPRYIAGFASTMLLATGGFMLMPFGSTYVVQNLGLSLDNLPFLYMINGACAMSTGPLIGRLSDALGKYRTFVAGSVLSIVMIVWYTGLEHASFTLIVVLNVLLFMGISGRMVASFALGSALPAMHDRGAYMAINSSLQQLAGGVAAWVAGLIVHQANPSAPLEHYATLGYVASGAAVVTMGLMYNVHRLVAETPQPQAAPVTPAGG
jgi:predicted MFS family arabinose efflux permease